MTNEEKVRLPEGWAEVKLADITEKDAPIVYGIVQAGPHIEGGVPYIKSANVGGKINVQELACTSEEIARKYARAECKPGDLIFSLRGNIGELSFVPQNLIRANLTQGTARIRIKEAYSPVYISNYLKSERTTTQIKKAAKGSTFQEISLDQLRKLPIFVPPLPEQRRIASILSQWDDSLSILSQLIDAKRQQKRGLAEQLLTGKRRLPGFEGEWEEKSFIDFFRIVASKSYQVQKSEYREKGAIPVIDQGQKFIAAYADGRQAFTDVPIIVFGDHTRVTKWVDFAFVPGADGTVLLKNTVHSDAKFSYYLLEVAKIPNLGYSRHLKILKEMLFLVPPIIEQQAIANVLSTMDSEIAALEALKAKVAEQKRGLMDALLTGRVRVNVEDAS